MAPQNTELLDRGVKRHVLPEQRKWLTPDVLIDRECKASIDDACTRSDVRRLNAKVWSPIGFRL